MKPEERGEHDYWRGKNLNDNPYQSSSPEGRKWEQGNWQGYDDHKARLAGGREVAP